MNANKRPVLWVSVLLGMWMGMMSIVHAEESLMSNVTVDEGHAYVEMPSANVELVDFEPSMFSGNKIHQYLGLGSLAFAAASAVTAPESEGSTVKQPAGFHKTASYAAAYLGGAAVASGLIVHWDDFHVEDGFLDPDNLHAILGLLGTLGYAYAISKAPQTTGVAGGESHAAAGMAGAASMTAAIVITW